MNGLRDEEMSELKNNFNQTCLKSLCEKLSNINQYYLKDLNKKDLEFINHWIDQKMLSYGWSLRVEDGFQSGNYKCFCYQQFKVLDEQSELGKELIGNWSQGIFNKVKNNKENYSINTIWAYNKIGQNWNVECYDMNGVVNGFLRDQWEMNEFEYKSEYKYGICKVNSKVLKLVEMKIVVLKMMNEKMNENSE